MMREASISTDGQNFCSNLQLKRTNKLCPPQLTDGYNDPRFQEFMSYDTQGRDQGGLGALGKL